MKAAELWEQWGLRMTKKGGPHCNLHNAATILENDTTFKNLVNFDEFLNRVVTQNSPVREWKDDDDLRVARYMQDTLAISGMGRDVVAQAVYYLAYQNVKNCVKDWLEGLGHDGTQRLESFFSDHFGATYNDYTKAASKNFWLSMVARAYKPGCKVDNMIVLEGAQGAGKSTALQIIGGDWFAEQHESATNPKAFAEILQGKLLIEISEMDAFSRVEVNRVKQTVSCAADRFRASYARYAVDHPRTCVFVGTTNRDDWNRDETGARRFWPVACKGSINLQGIRDAREQLFAEAVARYKANESHWEMPLELAQAEQTERYHADPWLDPIEKILKGESFVTTEWILGKLGLDIVRQGRSEEMRVATCLRFLRWERGRKRIDGNPTRGYHSPGSQVDTVGTGGNEIPL